MKSNVSIPDIVTQREFWNTWIKDCLQTEKLDQSSATRGKVVLGLLKSFNLLNPNILEVGCANGWLSLDLARFGQVTGVDLADSAIAAAKTKVPHINFVAGDFLRLDLPMEHFDVVVSVDTISHVENQSAFVDRIAAVLKPGGYLILICQNKFVWDRTDFIRRSHGEIIVDWPNIKDLKRLLRPQFSLLHRTTILPDGHRGVLRLINSYRLNVLIQKVIPHEYIIMIKERIGLGKSLVVVAQKRI